MSAKKKKVEETNDEAEAATTAPEGEGADGEASGASKKGKKKLIMIAGAVVLLAAIGAGVMFSGVLGGGEEAKKEEEHAAAVKAEEAAKVAAVPVYYELPQFLVNLNSPTGRVSFLKMSVTLQLRDTEAVALMDANKPRIVDTFNTYLRELRPSDIQGSAGIYRLRNELLTRLNSTIEEGVAKDILFGEIIVQ